MAVTIEGQRLGGEMQLERVWERDGELTGRG